MPMMKETMLKRLLLPIAAAGGGGFAPVQDTATGNPLVFFTDLARPLKSLLIPFTPVQSGSGDPSPQNIRPIVPWNGLTVWNGGKNLFDESQLVTTGITLSDGWYTGTRLSFYNAFGKDGNKFACPTFKENTQYTLKVTGKNSDSNGGWFVIRYVGGGTTTQLQITGTEEQTQSVTSTAGKTIERIDFTYPTVGSETFYMKNIQLEVGQIATAYEPYEPITETDISFPSPVYGGTLDVVSGVLTVEWAQFVATGAETETWTVSETSNKDRYVLNKSNFGEYSPKASGVCICNWLKKSTSSEWGAWIGSTSNLLLFTPLDEFASVDDWRSYLAENNLQIVYELAEPFEITLTPEQITALKGENTIWSDADGSMTAVYLKKG